MDYTVKKTLIVAQGLERERILAAVSLHSPTRLVILRNTHDLESVKKDVETTLDQVKKDLETTTEGRLPLFPLLAKIEMTAHSCNFFDLCESLEKTSTVIQSELESGAHVVIDISSGVKIVSTAMYLAAVLNGVRASYVIAGKYGSQEGVSEMPSDLSVLPAQYAFSVKGSRILPILPLIFKALPYRRLHRIAALQNGYAKSVGEISDSKDKKDIMQTTRDLRSLMSEGLVEAYGKGYRVSSDGNEVAKIKNPFSASGG